MKNKIRNICDLILGLVLAVLAAFLLFGCIYHFGNRLIRSKVLKK